MFWDRPDLFETWCSCVSRAKWSCLIIWQYGCKRKLCAYVEGALEKAPNSLVKARTHIDDR